MTTSTGWAVALAVACVAGASNPARSTALAIALVGLTALTRHPVIGCLALGLCASTLAQRSLDGLDGVAEQTVAASVTLVGDPTPSFGGVRVDVRLGGRRLEARAGGPAATALEDRLAGEVVTIRGTVSPAPAQPWLTARHVSGRLSVHAVEGWVPGDPSSRVANGLRRTLDRGAVPLGERQRALFTGLVIGDDRRQPPDLADSFRGAGLTHLLAVSGQNVAFVLVLAGPVLRRLRIWPRWIVTLALIGLFGVMTRFEPSVLRASAMAALAATLTLGGQPAARVRVIALAVAGLVLVDPLLVRSVGFQLSVSAALAIVVLAPRLVSVVPGPGWFRDALSVTVAAQLGVAPVLLRTFGPLPVASLPANLLAVPVAGAVMVWGLTAGLVAGLVAPGVSEILHVPTRVGLRWLEEVASRSSMAPLGVLDAAHVVAIVVGVGLAALGPGRRSITLGRVLVVGALAAGVLAANAPPPLRSAPQGGVVRWHADHTDVVVLGGAGGRSSLGAAAVLGSLRDEGVRGIDLLVVADASVPAAVLDAVRQRHPIGLELAHRRAIGAGIAPTAVPVPDAGARFVLGGLEVRLVVVPDRVVVDAVPEPRGP